MPLDAIGTIHAVRTTDQMLADARIIPVNEALLEVHKRQEVKANPASFLYPHKARLTQSIVIVGLGSIAVVIVSIVTIIVLRGASIYTGADLDSNLPWYFGMTAVFAIGGVMLFERMMVGINIKGPAHWIEHSIRPYCFTTYRVPPAIQVLARQMAKQGSVVFTLGTLMQEQTMLDPYLLVSATDAKQPVCLGVWKDRTILHIATTSLRKYAMPLDNIGTSIRGTADLLAAARIIPVNEALLATHKWREIEANPASRLHPHMDWLREVRLSSLVVLFAMSLVLALCLIGLSFSQYWWIGIVLVCAGIYGFGRFCRWADRNAIKGPAIWTDYIIPAGCFSKYQVPAEIQSLARRMMEHGQVRFICGVLMQDETMLDPYLMVAADDFSDPVCLGVWKDDEIIHIASTY